MSVGAIILLAAFMFGLGLLIGAEDREMFGPLGAVLLFICFIVFVCRQVLLP